MTAKRRWNQISIRGLVACSGVTAWVAREDLMRSDEQEIRELVAKWMYATTQGDSETVLSLMAEDATFVVPGQPPFGKKAFASAANSRVAASVEIDGESEILELTVAGEWAFMLSHLTVKVKADGKPQMVRAGNTLTIFSKQNGRWLLFRDANLLVPVPASGDVASQNR